MLYNVQNPMQQAMGGMNQAANTYGGMMKDIPAHQDPGPSVGGAMMSGMSGAATAAAAGSALSTVGASTAAGAVGGPWGMAAGAVIGIGSYLLS